MSERHLSSADALPALKKDTLRIYSMLYCPFAQRPRLVLEHKQIPFETVNVNLKEKPAWFFERNPNGTVPVMEKDDKVLYESIPIMEYLDEIYPQSRLTPTDPYVKTKGKILDQEFSKVYSLFYQALRANSDEERAAKKEELYDKMETFQSYMPGTNFLSGDEVALVDYSCWPFFERFPLLGELPTDRFAKLHAWIAAMEETPGVKATRISLEGHKAYFSQHTSGKPFDYDFRLK